MTHGFDDQGSQYDAEGNLKNWWTKEDSTKFAQKTQVLADQFSKMLAVDTFHVNGRLTLGENIADLGGLIIAYEAFKRTPEGKSDKKNNVLKRAPHTQANVCSNDWDRPYSRVEAAFPAERLKENKFWPSIARVNNTYGDRNLVCTCEPVESYAQ